MGPQTWEVLPGKHLNTIVARVIYILIEIVEVWGLWVLFSFSRSLLCHLVMNYTMNLTTI